VNETSKQATSSSTPLKSVKFITEKGGQYRIFHADGVWVLGCGNDNALLEFYVEHPPLPSLIVQPRGPDGHFSGEQEVHGVSDQKYWLLTREFQAGVVLTPQAILQLHQVLGNIIDNSPQMKSLLESGFLKKV